ncbi:LysR family transcriptional regulator [bacterium]|nr:LysR family transcriptional regulator [bacterium]
MEIRYLEEFLQLASYMSYTVAARKLNLTQSALSKHMAALERELDVTLVDRSHQQIELTPQGRVFCEEASKVLDAYHGAYRRLHEASSEVRAAGSLRDSAIRYLLSTTQDALREDGGTLHVVSCECAPNALRDALLDKKVDFVINVMPVGEGEVAGDGDVEPVDDLEIEHRYLTSVPLLAVVESTSPLAGRASVSLGDLADLSIMHPTGSLTVQRGAAAIEGIFARHGITMRKHIFFANSWDDFPTVQLRGSVFVMPRSLYSRQLFGSSFGAYRGIPISDVDARFPYQLFWRHNERDATVTRYIQALMRAARAIDGQDG